RRVAPTRLTAPPGASPRSAPRPFPTGLLNGIDDSRRRLTVTDGRGGATLEERSRVQQRGEMTITIHLKPEEERWLRERAARTGEDIESVIHHLIAREIQSPATIFDVVLFPGRQQFEESGMPERDPASRIEEVREDPRHKKKGRPSRGS